MVVAKGQITITAVDPIASNTEPPNKFVGMVWIDTSVTPPIQKVWNGSEWLIVSDPTKLINDAQAAAKAYTDAQAVLTKVMMESYMDGIISNAERLAITAAENALVDAYKRLLELRQNLASGGVQLLREYDIAFNFKYWGGTGTAGDVDLNNITVIEAFVMGGLIGSTSFDYVDENGKKIEIIY